MAVTQEARQVAHEILDAKKRAVQSLAQSFCNALNAKGIKAILESPETQKRIINNAFKLDVLYESLKSYGRGNSGDTSLRPLRMAKVEEIVGVVLGKGKIDLNEESCGFGCGDYKSVLSMAFNEGLLTVARSFLERGANPDYRDDDGLPSHWAVRDKDIDALKLLAEFNADFESPVSIAGDHYGSLIEMAEVEGFPEGTAIMRASLAARPVKVRQDQGVGSGSNSDLRQA